MMQLIAGSLRLYIWMLIGVLLAASGCTIQVAPAYSPAFVTKVEDANTKTLQFYASLRGGAKKTTFASRSSRYDDLIGTFDALSIESAARPAPQSGTVTALKRQLGMAPSAKYDDKPASAPDLADIADILRDLRQLDESGRLEGEAGVTQVALHRDDTIGQMKRVLAYEKFLNRDLGE